MTFKLNRRTRATAERGGYFAILVSALAAIGFAPMATSHAEDWPHWRGSSRTGIVAEGSGWDGRSWVDAQPAWTANVGEGASSPLVIGDQAILVGHRDGRDIVTCLELKTGQTAWTTSYSAPRYGRNATGDEGLYSGPTSTPEYDPESRLLYTLGADGALNCWDFQQRGHPVWHRNLYEDYHMPQRAKVGRSARRDYGYTSSPMTYGEWLLVEVGGPTGTIVAFDKRTGQESWRSEATSVAGHTGGMAPLTVEGIPCIAVMTFDGLLVVRLDAQQAGRTVATYPWVTDFANNIAGPAVRGDAVWITSDYNHQALCKLRITLRGAEKLWEQPVASKACTPVVHAGRIYLAWQRLRALDEQTGELLWEGPTVGDAGSCVVTSDEKLVVWAQRGELFLVDIGRRDSKYQELARVSRLATSDVWPHVALANRRILCRDRMGTVNCFSTK